MPSKKAGPKNSRYRLYVEFLPAYQFPRRDFNYFSNDQKGSEKGLKELVRRVLKGTARGRYRKAMLYEVATNTCLSVFTPDRSEMTFVEYQSLFEKPFKKPLLKAYIICYRSYIDTLIKQGHPHPIILDSIDVDEESGRQGSDVALFNFREMLLNSHLNGNVLFAYIYRQSDNHKVVKFDHQGALTFLDDSFEKMIKKSTQYQWHQIGIF